MGRWLDTGGPLRPAAAAGALASQKQAVVTVNAAYLSQFNVFLWWQRCGALDRLVARSVDFAPPDRPLQIDFFRERSDAPLFEPPHGHSIVRMLTSRTGAWLMTSDGRVRFWNSMQQWLELDVDALQSHSASNAQVVAASSSSARTSTIVNMCTHANTHDLVMLVARDDDDDDDYQSSLDVYVAQCRQHRKLSCRYLCSVAVSAASIDRDNAIAYQHTLVLFNVDTNMALFFDLRSGASVSPPQRVGQPRLWRVASMPACSVGVWNTDGVWQLTLPPIGEHARRLLSTSPDSAIQMCADWALDKVAAALLLDHLIEAHRSDTLSGERRRQLVDAVLPRLQNPGLAVALLANDPSSRTYVDGIIEQFLRTQASDEHSLAATPRTLGDAEALQLRARTAFERHTELNIAVADKLARYRQLIDARRAHQVKLDGGGSDAERLEAATAPSLQGTHNVDKAANVLALDASQLGAYMLHYPEEALRRLMAAIDDANAGGLLRATDDDGDMVDYYAALCRLLYRVDIERLLPFVESRDIDDRHGRASDALPPLRLADAPALTEAQLRVRVALLRAARRNVAAMHLLLALGSLERSWSLAIAVLADAAASADGLAHAQLFDELLSAVLDNDDGADVATRCQSTCEHAPSSINTLQLLRFINARRRPRALSLATIKAILLNHLR
jgi:hypothetical protein